jgi:hypothetical protein
MIIVWVVIIVLSSAAYIPVTKLLIIERPYPDKIIISNLTLNLLLLVGLVGALSPKITKKLWPKAPRWAFILTALLLGVVIVFLLKALGMNTKF